MPVVVAMSAGYPNPSSGIVEFALDLPGPTEFEMSVYDMQGRQVWSHREGAAAGRSTLRWDGRDRARRSVGVGVYLVRVRAGEQSLVRRVIRM